MLRITSPLTVLFCLAAMASAQEKAAPAGKIDPVAVNLGRPVDFQKDIVPILDSKCIACHNVAIAESRLNLEDVPNILKGGKRGPAVIAKDPDKSLMYQVAARAAEPAMPPLPNKVSAAAFTPQELGLLRQWITEGAPAGMGGTTTAIAWQAIPSTMNSIYSVAMTPWGRFAACGRANQLDVYDLSVGESVARLTDPALAAAKTGDKPLYPRGAAHQDFVHALAFHPSGNLLASAGFREVKFWSRPDAIQRQKFALDPAPTAVAVSADGKWIAIAGADNNIRVVQAADGQVSKTLAGHAAPVTGLQFAPDSSQLFSASKDKTVRAWNLTNGQPAGQLDTPAEIASLLLAVDGKRVYTGHADNHIRAWNVPFDAPKPAEGDKPAEPVKPVVQFQSANAVSVCLAHVPGQPQIASGTTSGNWFVWDINNGSAVRTTGHGAPMTAIAVSANGQMLLTAGGNIAKLWNINGQPIADLKGNLAAQRGVLTLTDDDAVMKSRIAIADTAFKAAEKNFKEREEQTKKAIEAKTNAEKAKTEADAKLKTATDAVTAAKAELANKADDEALKKKVADAEAAAAKEMEAAKKAMETLDSAVKAVAQSEKGQQTADEQQKVAKQAHEAEVALGKAAEEKLNAAKAALPAAEKPIRTVTFTADGKLAVTAGDDGVVRTWDAKTGKPLDEFTGHTAPVNFLATGPDRLLVSLSEDKSAILWDSNPQWQFAGVIGPNAAAPLDLGPSPFVNRVLSLAFSPDGKLLATGGGEPSRSGEVLLWNVETKAFVKALPDAHSDTVFGLEFSRDGKWLVSGAADKFVKVHEVETGKLVRSFEGHTHHVLGVSFKADTNRIASAGADNAIKIWNVETGEQHRTIQNYSKQVTSIHFIGTSDNIISGSGDKSVKMHRANDGGNYRGFGGPTDFVYSVACTRDESVAIAGGEDGVLRVWNGTNGQVLYSFEPPKPPADNTQAAK
ncbi:MAG TPA: c-type cytochrome domain-containing protein [Planctomycetaceae bacterium]|nr:c-type cytochrome domain-containing protein [Planctomycetaceae bacterium]